ncbi:MAG TPA: hypothetical protein VK098_08375 [Beutenbergiaceae bacterium]|nr:hypothetical protein [Beutenbergiaceae bacterium]
MAKFPPQDDDSEAGSSRDPRDLTKDEVDAAFSGIAAEYVNDSLPGPRDYTVTEEEEQFVPPNPGPVASSDPFLTLGWTLLAGGLLVILLSLMVWPSAPRLFHIGCAIAVLIGGAILTWRMPRNRRDDDDLGAVV